VSFQLNATVIKIGSEFNTRRNTRFIGRGDKMEQNNDVGLTSPPRYQNQVAAKINDYREKCI
jgi:hypothetical protein